MTLAPVGPGLGEALDVLRALAPQVTFDHEVVVDRLAKLDDLVVGEVLHVPVRRDPGLLEDIVGAGAPQSVDRGEPDLDSLVERDVDPCNSCHLKPDF